MNRGALRRLAAASFSENSDEKPRRILTEIEIARLFSVAEGRDALLLKCLYFLGLRNSELRNLSIEDIDLKKGMIFIGKEKKKATIPSGFAPELAAVTSKRAGPLFSGRSEGRLSDRHIRRIVKRCAMQAGLEHPEEVRPFTLTHSYRAHLD